MDWYSIAPIISTLILPFVGYFLGRRKSSRELQDKKLHKIRRIITGLSETWDSISHLEGKLRSLDPKVLFFTRVIPLTLDSKFKIDSVELRLMEASFQETLNEIRSFDSALYLSLYKDQKGFIHFRENILVPLVNNYNTLTLKKNPALIDAFDRHLSDLESTILSLAENLPEKEKSNLSKDLVRPSEDNNVDIEALAIGLSEYYTKLFSRMEIVVSKENVLWILKLIDNQACALFIEKALRHYNTMLPNLDVVSQNNIVHSEDPLAALQDHFGEVGELNILQGLKSVSFSPQEDRVFEGNKEFFVSFMSVVHYFGVKLSFSHKKKLIGILQGTASMNEVYQDFIYEEEVAYLENYFTSMLEDKDEFQGFLVD